jgi:hypothetical protein
MSHTTLLVSLCLVFSHAIAAADAEMDWPALWRGEVLVETIENSQGLPGLRAVFVVPAARERIWSVLLDYQHYAQIFTGIDKMQVLEQDAHGAKIEFWVDAVLRKYHYVVYRYYEQPGRRLTWRRLSGDLQRLEGSWEIRDTPERDVHLLVYESYVQVGGIVPLSLVRWSAMQKAREMGQGLRQWIARLSVGH